MRILKGPRLAGTSSTTLVAVLSLGLLTESWASLLLALEVPVIVQEPAGIARKAEPVSGGIALAAGMFKPGTVKLALFDGTRPVPAQVSELVVGPTGFVRWVLLDFQLDLRANQTKTLTLKASRPAAPHRPLNVTETAGAGATGGGQSTAKASRCPNPLARRKTS